jgi:hypothetical protein
MNLRPSKDDNASWSCYEIPDCRRVACLAQGLNEKMGVLLGAGLRMAQLLQELRGMFIVFTVVDMRHQRILLMSNMKNLSVVPDNASAMVAQKCAVSSSFTPVFLV